MQCIKKPVFQIERERVGAGEGEGDDGVKILQEFIAYNFHFVIYFMRLYIFRFWSAIVFFLSSAFELTFYGEKWAISCASRPFYALCLFATEKNANGKHINVEKLFIVANGKKGKRN